MGNGTIPSNLNQCDHFIPGRALRSRPASSYLLYETFPLKIAVTAIFIFGGAPKGHEIWCEIDQWACRAGQFHKDDTDFLRCKGANQLHKPRSIFQFTSGV